MIHDCILGIRNPHFARIVDVGYLPVTNAYISINISWLYTI
jgi:hypothetical protein